MGEGREGKKGRTGKGKKEIKTEIQKDRRNKNKRKDKNAEREGRRTWALDRPRRAFVQNRLCIIQDDMREESKGSSKNAPYPSRFLKQSRTLCLACCCIAVFANGANMRK